MRIVGIASDGFFPFDESRAPVAQSVATWAVNPGVVSSNPGSANFLSDDDRSLCDMRHLSTINGLSLCGKAASCLGRLLCGVLV